MTDLRDKIARALAEWQDGPNAEPWVHDMHTEAADAVLAVLDLDTIRAEAWERGFDAGQAWESDVSSRVIPSVSRQDNPYRRAEQ